MLRSLPHSRSSHTNRTQVMLMDRLEAEFPSLSWLIIYKAVASARNEATKVLPDMLAYSRTLEQYARDALLRAADDRAAGSGAEAGGF